MIRHAKIADLPLIRDVAASTGMFLGDELEEFCGQLQQHLQLAESTQPTDATLLVASDDYDPSHIIGSAYFAPEMMARGVINLLFIGVHPLAREKGVGTTLLQSFETAVRETNARLAIIETASDNMFAPAWSLYKKAGYSEEARVRDYYDDGLDKMIFRKRP
ncbi:MAG: GNAT family N-acetyltransferase [Parvularculaceae bacterium]|nr:GNAT family N-acetyltransferase [Parvularculaceae bacterium]